MSPSPDAPPGLSHFSEERDLRRFEPRAPVAHPDRAPRVWAIDDWHAPMYYVPRDCPRACFWAGPDTSEEDRRWLGDAGQRFVIAIESGWLERVRASVLYRYRMPSATFVLADPAAGHWVSHAAVTPIAVEPMADLLAALASSEVELRVLPSLVSLWQRVVGSTLCFSGTRLRNARGFAP